VGKGGKKEREKVPGNWDLTETMKKKEGGQITLRNFRGRIKKHHEK